MTVAMEREARLGVGSESGCWPTPLQKLVLRAALLEGREALDAWQEWKNTADLDAIDIGSHRMLPQLYHNLSTHGVRDRLLQKFTSVYRYYWYKNEMLLRTGAAVLKVLHQAGLETMALKGAALIPLYYRHAALRPMNDFDIAVPVSRVTRAMRLLDRLGWRSSCTFAPALIPILHATAFSDAQGQQLDLHWHVLRGCWNATHDSGFWHRSVAISIGHQPTRALDPTDQLLHICWHGAEWNPVPAIRWVADAMMILKTDHARVDWERFVQQAALHHLHLPIYHSLTYLRKNFQACIPERVLENIGSLPRTKLEQHAYRMLTEPITQPTTRELLRTLRYEYHRLASGVPAWRGPLLFALWLRGQFAIEKPWRLLFILPYRALRWTVRRTSWHGRTLWLGLGGA